MKVICHVLLFIQPAVYDDLHHTSLSVIQNVQFGQQLSTNMNFEICKAMLPGSITYVAKRVKGRRSLIEAQRTICNRN